MSQQRPCIVLDLNGTILQSVNRPLHFLLPGGTTGGRVPLSARTRTKYVYLRPHAISFLDWLTQRCRVGIWTSCVRHNAQEIVEAVVPPFVRERFEFVLDRSACVKLPGPGFRTIKDLRVVHERFGWPPDRTWAVDDTDEKFSRQPDRLLRIPEYLAARDPYDEDRELLTLARTVSRIVEHFAPRK